jgi:hypothetical protein
LGHPWLDLEHLEFVRLGIKRPRARIQCREPLERCLVASDGRAPRDPEKLWRVEQHVAHSLQVMGILSATNLLNCALTSSSVPA